MPLLDIATPQSSFRNNLYSIGFQRLHHASFISGNQSTAGWRYFRLPDKLNSIQMCRGRLMIKAVATLEPRCSDKEKHPQQLPIDSTTYTDDDDMPIQDEKERLRRKRISNANRGKEPWNKGKQHSPETRQKIRERTRIAMHTPKVKMKLLKGIHSQSPETRKKIAAALRRTWGTRQHNRKMCHNEWRNLVAEASRKGVCGEEELQWDSYDVLLQQHEKEFQEGIELRKIKAAPKRGHRAPKSVEQRKKISEAIAAKWADPTYRDRVYSGIAKKRGSGAEKRDPEWGTGITVREKEAKKARREGRKVRRSPHVRAVAAPRPKLKTSSTTSSYKGRYKDPEARYKLEMIKSIRAQRAASDPKISEAILRAKVLIGEAQRAAEALEVAAEKSPMAEASLIETRKLIAEAVRYIESIETGSSSQNDATPDIEQKGAAAAAAGVNGVAGGVNAELLGLKDKDEVANGTEHIDLSSSSSLSSWGLQMKEVEAEADGGMKMASEKQQEREGGGGRRRRWVCGRLVEDQDEEEDDEQQ